MLLVDSSSWIETLRVGGNPRVRARVAELVLAGHAAWCDIIRVELWQGARGQREAKELAQLESVVTSLEIDADVWEHAIKLARRARAAGLTTPSADLLIVATALRHGVELDHCDKHLAKLQQIA
jgi:predicted nucleic acid-binding protein